jgi:L-lysine 6-transaminase
VTNPKLRFPITAEVLAEVQAAERQAIAEIEKALADNPHDIAGLVIEPIQGEGGDNHFRPEFLRELRGWRRARIPAHLRRSADRLRHDRQVVGVRALRGRARHLRLRQEDAGRRHRRHFALDEVESVFEISSRINSTWGGNLVDMVRCQRIIEIIEAENLLDNATRVGEHLLAGLRRLERTFPGRVTNARGLGLFLAFDLPDADSRRRALAALLDADVLGLASGERAIRMRPPLVLSIDEADEGLRRIESALAQTLA